MGPQVVIAAGIAVVAGARWVARQRWRARWKLRRATRAPLGALPEGRVARVVGKARSAGTTLQAPLSGRTCLAYYVRIESRQAVSNNDGLWTSYLEEQGGVPFAVDDGTGRALVDPRDAELALELDAAEQVGETHARAVAFLERHGKVIARTKLRYREGVIEEGEHVAVLGAGVREPDPDAAPASYRGEQPTRLVLASSARQRLVISDKPETTR